MIIHMSFDHMEARPEIPERAFPWKRYGLVSPLQVAPTDVPTDTVGIGVNETPGIVVTP